MKDSFKAERETELKFLLDSPVEMKRRLSSIGFSSSGKHYEKNIVFDTPDSSLQDSRRLLRLRQDSQNRLTFKEPDPDADIRFKQKIESETTVGDFDTTRHILEKLGYTKQRVYEKYREHFSRGDSGAELDRLPHIGWVLELEAPAEAMEELVGELGLEIGDGLALNYFELFRRFCAERGLEPTDMLFADEVES